MKKILLLVLACGIFASAFAQNETDKWEISPAKGLKKGMGSLNLNFPAGVEWDVNIYTSQNKFIINRNPKTFKQKYYDLVPGIYNFKLNTVLIENVPVEEGKITTLKTGKLEINSNDWQLRDESKKKFLTSDNKSRIIALPVGKYQLGETGVYKLVEVIYDVQINPEILIDDQYQYIMSPIPTSDTVLTTMGRLNFGLNAGDLSVPGYAYEFRVGINDETSNMVKSCGGLYYPCSQDIYLPEGKYTVVIAWRHEYGQIVVHSPIRIFSIPIKKGYETRVKLGFFRHDTNGDFELLNETKEISYWSYISRVSMKRLLPVGRYILRQPGIGEFPIQIEDGKIESLNILPADGFNKKLEVPAFRISPIVAKDLKPGMGRLNCDFPLADTACCYRLIIPDANGVPTSINLLTMKSIDLLPGKYELKMSGLLLPFEIEKQKETKIICGYMILPSRKKFCDAIRGGCATYISYRTIPIRPGYYYIYDVEDNPGRTLLIRIREGEITDFNQSILIRH
ncbi:MAG: hypothetical protein JNK27_07045 [Chitinophagaceae bacterium]|nr:hypothetical protein [Chitinophagaceae bacterium]